MDNSPTFVISEDELELTESLLQKRKPEIPNSPLLVPQPKKPRRPIVAGSGFNLVSYGIDNEDEDGDLENSGSNDNRSGASTGSNRNDDDAEGEASTLHFVVSDGGPLTVFSSEHKMSDLQAAIEAAQESPTSALDEAQNGGMEQGDNSRNSSPSNSSNPKQLSDVQLPPEPKELCNMYLQNTVETTVRRMQHDIAFDPNRMIQDNKAFRNPSIYKKLISFLDIDEKGTNFSQDVFNPYRWDSNSFYDKLGEIQNREVERLEKLRKERRKAESTATNAANGIQRAASGPNLGSADPPNATAKNVAIEVKKKTKWDTVDSTDHNQQMPKVVASRPPDGPSVKVTIPAVGNLFQKK